MIYRKLKDLHKLEGNPRVIKDDKFMMLVQSIRDSPKGFFESRPLILSNRTGKLVIIGGNQRFEACLFLKMKEVPTHLIEGLTEVQEKEITIRDNVSNGSWDWDNLANLYSDLDLKGLGLDVWQDDEQEKGWSNDGSGTGEPAKTEKVKIKLIIHFDSEDEANLFLEDNRLEVKKKDKNQWVTSKKSS